MKLIIAGGRDINFTIAAIDRWLKCFKLEPTKVVCGKARGIDTCGENWAKHKNIPIQPFPANWKKFGLAAGPIRNGEMADYGDVLLLIWDGQSRGSGNMRKQMIERNKPVYEIIIDKETNEISSTEIYI